MKVLPWIAMLVAAAGAALAGCGKAGADDDANTIRIGVSLPLSGNLSPLGQGARDGVVLRVDEINAAGGVGGKRLRLFIEDNRGDQGDARNSFKKLADIDHVVAVIGPLTSTSALAVKMDAEQSKVPMISPTATNDKVTQNCRYMFRACFTDDFQGHVVANYAFKTLGLRKASAMVDQSSDYSKGLVASFRKYFQAAGGQVVAEEGYQQRDTDFGTQLKKITASGAQTIFVPGYPPELPLIIGQAKGVGFAGRLCGADGWDNDAVIQNAGDNIEGCFLVGAFSPQDDRPIVRKFVQAAQAKTGRVPGTFEALGYDSVSLLVEAMKNGTGREQIRDGLAGLKDFDAVTGRISINARDETEKEAVILNVVREGNRFATKHVATIGPASLSE